MAIFGIVVLAIFILGTFTIALMLFPDLLRYMKLRFLLPIINSPHRKQSHTAAPRSGQAV
jgi:hypothetical protein